MEKVSNICFDWITDILEGNKLDSPKIAKRKVLFLHHLRKVFIEVLKENPNISLYNFIKNFVDITDKDFSKFIEEFNSKTSKIEDKSYFELSNKLKEISQRVSNITQSKRMLSDKFDKVYGLFIQEKEKVDKQINSLFEYFKELNDKIRILERGKSILDGEQ